MFLEGGNNPGNRAHVDGEGRAQVKSTSVPEPRHLAGEGLVNSIYFTVTPAGANDYFFYLKNTGTVDISITDFRASAGTVTKLYIERVSGTPVYVTGTDAQITNRKSGNSTAVNADIKYDTDITGLTSQGIWFFQDISDINTTFKLSTSASIILPQGQALAIRSTAIAAIEMEITTKQSENG